MLDGKSWTHSEHPYQRNGLGIKSAFYIPPLPPFRPYTCHKNASPESHTSATSSKHRIRHILLPYRHPPQRHQSARQCSPPTCQNGHILQKRAGPKSSRPSSRHLCHLNKDQMTPDKRVTSPKASSLGSAVCPDIAISPAYLGRRRWLRQERGSGRLH